MKEGTVPVPPNRPCADRDADVVPVQDLLFRICSTFSGVIAYGGAEAAGVKPP